MNENILEEIALQLKRIADALQTNRSSDELTAIGEISTSLYEMHGEMQKVSATLKCIHKDLSE